MLVLEPIIRPTPGLSMPILGPIIQADSEPVNTDSYVRRALTKWDRPPRKRQDRPQKQCPSATNETGPATGKVSVRHLIKRDRQQKKYLSGTNKKGLATEVSVGHLTFNASS